MPLTVCTVVGARPQFIKAAVVSRALAGAGLREMLVHTGQHYDDAMSRVFFEELSIPEPHLNLEVGSGPHGRQTGEIMARLEAALLAAERLPDWMLVYGDTNSTLAAALVAAKLHVPIAHVEAGLRSFVRAMPEEVNRVVTDQLSTLLCCPSAHAAALLAREGITAGVHVTGDVMFDAVRAYLPAARARYPAGALTEHAPGGYVLATLHRAENTDDPARLKAFVALLAGLGRPVVWPVHPRTRARLAACGLAAPGGVAVLEPVGYLAMLSLLDGADRVLTDSGGLQKEAFWLEKPCVTLRDETEWVETLADGWNATTGLDPARVQAALAAVPTAPPGAPYGAADASDRIARLLAGATAAPEAHAACNARS